MKVVLAGPLKVRMDYRAFRLARTGGHSNKHRIYVGIAVGF